MLHGMGCVHHWIPVAVIPVVHQNTPAPSGYHYLMCPTASGHTNHTSLLGHTYHTLLPLSHFLTFSNFSPKSHPVLRLPPNSTQVTPPTSPPSKVHFFRPTRLPTIGLHISRRNSGDTRAPPEIGCSRSDRRPHPAATQCIPTACHCMPMHTHCNPLHANAYPLQPTAYLFG